jgi:5-formyltetrahydrofolate cyclo-ligase
MAPTYFRREPGIATPAANAAPHSCSTLVSDSGRDPDQPGTRAPATSYSLDVISSPIAAAKSDLRTVAVARRDALPAAERMAAAEAIAARAFPVALAPGAIVSGFMPLNSEINPLPLMRKLSDAGARLALPVVVGRGVPLLMRAYAFGDALVKGVWGIRVPPPEAPAVEPDVLLVPLLAFDRNGYRLGYGAGYYDMTITALRAKKRVVAVGIAFAAQEVEVVPTTSRDARLDLVLTEREVIIVDA